MSFDLQQFTQFCLDQLSSETPQKNIAEELQVIIQKPHELMAEIGQPTQSAIQKFYVSDELTIVNVVWAPKMTLLPHNHNMWAIIGVYSGREDNIFWRRCKSDSKQVEAAGAKSLAAGELAALGKDLIHSVTNPSDQFTGAIHIYGGNFFDMPRSEWETETLMEKPYDIQKNLKLFELENQIAKIRAGT